MIKSALLELDFFLPCAYISRVLAISCLQTLDFDFYYDTIYVPNQRIKFAMEPVKFFKHPATPGQRQYEALRAYYVDHVPGQEVSRRYQYTYSAFNSLKQKFKSGLVKFFITPPKGPQGSRITADMRQKIIDYRKKNLSAYQIAEVFETLDDPISVRTVARILEEEGFPKLPRRTQLKIGLTKNNTITPEYSAAIDFDKIENYEVDCAVGGIFLFVPLLERFKIPHIIKKSKLPHSTKINAMNYVMSMLALKLVGKERLSQINDFNFDKGIGLFAGLNVLPKATAISTYSFRLDQKTIYRFMKNFVAVQNKYKLYSAGTINLDFHTIQHYGEEAVLEEHWAGAKNKRVKGALTFIAQDCDSRCQIYVNADLHKRDADDEILTFVKFWQNIRGKFKQTLVFDSKLTTYENLLALDADGITFITLRRRGVKLVTDARKLPLDCWKRITLTSPNRKYPKPLVYDSIIELKGYGEIRQIIMRDNGREEPAFFITNDLKSTTEVIVNRYAKRWNVENSIDEAVQFFHLNALSSPILIKIHFDVLLTMIADTFYYQLAQMLRGFEMCEAKKIFRHFIDMPAKIAVSEKEIVVKYPLRAHNPVLRSAGLDKWIEPISWLGNRKLRFQWV